jgi:hypothetical protein
MDSNEDCDDYRRNVCEQICFKIDPYLRVFNDVPMIQLAKASVSNKHIQRMIHSRGPKNELRKFMILA